MRSQCQLELWSGVEDYDVDGAEGNPDDAELPGVVDMGMDESDDANQSPPEILEPEVNINEPNIIQPEQQLIEQQPPNAEVPVAKEPSNELRRRTTHIRCWEQRHAPGMQGSWYSYAASTQIAQGELYPDSHMFVQDNFYQYDINIIAYVMNQLSLKAALKM